VWSLRIQRLSEIGRDGAFKYHYEGTNGPLSYAEVIGLWQSSAQFRSFFCQTLRDCPFTAYFWETPPITTDTVAREFECVVIESLALAGVPADLRSFAGQFRSASDDAPVVAFDNLGGDAYLIAPCPRAAIETYPHLGAFVRAAAKEQQHALWRAVGTEIERRLDTNRLWVSTAGLGVYWLHIRLDSYPKYYNYAMYRH
jgi:hypothetical protein